MFMSSHLIGFAAGGPSTKSKSFLFSGNNNTSLSSHSTASVPFGTPAEDRYILVVARTFSGTAPAISSMTIGGVSATAVVQLGSGVNRVAMYIALVPTGTTGTVAYTTAAASSQNAIGVYALYGLTSTTPVASGNTNPTLASVAGGFAIAADAGNPLLGSWSNVTQDFQEVTVDSYNLVGASGPTTGANITPTVNAETGVMVAATW